MRNLKKLIVPAVAGFVLSFFISLIATRGNFGAALLRGLLFAIIFAVLFFLVDFLFAKFLDGTESAVSSSKKSDAGLGAKVDITLSDEDLSDDGEDLKFYVGHNKVGLSQSATDVSRPPVKTEPVKSPDDIKPQVENIEKPAAVAAPVVQHEEKTPETKAPSSSSLESSFRPVPLGTPVEAVSEPAAKNEKEKVGDVDALPEISDFDSDMRSDADSLGSGKGSYEDDTDFTGSNEALYSRKKPGDEVSSGHDAATLAKAIQTILKREE